MNSYYPNGVTLRIKSKSPFCKTPYNRTSTYALTPAAGPLYSLPPARLAFFLYLTPLEPSTSLLPSHMLGPLCGMPFFQLLPLSSPHYSSFHLDIPSQRGFSNQFTKMGFPQLPRFLKLTHVLWCSITILSIYVLWDVLSHPPPLVWCTEGM